MSFELIFRVEAEADLSDINDYYNKISPDIAGKFFKEFFYTLTFIENQPELFQVRYRGIRIAPLYRFPYGIHYIKRNDKVIIFRVMHTKRCFK